MLLRFDTNGNDKQKEVAKLWSDKKTSDIIYGGSKGSGKSYLGVSLIFGNAFIYPETAYFIARKNLNDLRKHTIPSIHEVFNHWGITPKHYKFNGQDNYFTLFNNSKIYLIDAKYLPSDPLYYRFGSIQVTQGWIEEAGQFEESAKNNLSASIGRWKNDKYNLTAKLLQTCNPSKNYLYDYYLRNKENKLNDWESFIQALPTDNKKLPDGYLQRLERTLSKNEKERLLFGNWEYDDDPAILIDFENILNVFTNDFIESGKKYITVDVARLGQDKTVIMLWSGLRVEKIIVLAKSLVNEVVEVVKDLAKRNQVTNSNIIIDSDGVGGGVTDYLQGSYAFVNNAKALLDENYDNLKTQCYFKLAQLINENRLFINTSNPEYKKLISQELEVLKQVDFDKDGKKKILSKDKIKALIGRSPDFSDCLMMRIVKEIAPNISKSNFKVLGKRKNYNDIF